MALDTPITTEDIITIILREAILPKQHQMYTSDGQPYITTTPALLQPILDTIKNVVLGDPDFKAALLAELSGMSGVIVPQIAELIAASTIVKRVEKVNRGYGSGGETETTSYAFAQWAEKTVKEILAQLLKPELERSIRGLDGAAINLDLFTIEVSVQVVPKPVTA